MQYAKFFEKVTSDGHLPIGVGIFAVGTLVHLYHGLDASFVAFTSTVLTFLGAHEYMQPDPPKEEGK
jgi:hypothetical protein